MKSYRKSCEICESGEALCELFHRETSLSKDTGVRFSSHIAQNALLVSEALNVGAVCSGGFLDGEFIKEMEKHTELDLSDYVELYEMFLGNKK